MHQSRISLNANACVICFGKEDAPLRTQNRPIYCFDKRGKFLQRYETTAAAAIAIQYSAVSITGNLRGRVKSVGDYVFSYEKVFPGYSPFKQSNLQVDCFSLTRKYLRTYPNVMEASKALKIDYVKIYRCIHDKTCLDTGHYWAYRRKSISRAPKRVCAPNRPKIFQFNADTGKFIASFNSISDAAKNTGIDRIQINRCCLRKAKTAGGFRWATSYFAKFPPKP